MVSQRARELMTFARTLERALSTMGHTVYRGPDDADTPDLIIGGVTSVLSPGATYALIGLETIGRALDEDIPLLLFVDDPDLNKTRAAAQSALRDPDRVYSPYLMSKRVKQSRQLNKPQRRHVRLAIEMLAGETWPPVLMPLHPWASVAIAAKRISILSEVVPVDVSSAIELPQLIYPPQPAMLWLTDRHYSPHVLDPDRVNWPVIPIDSTTMANPAKVYSVARGVHQGAIERMPGWWTPTPLYVAHAGTVFLCDTDEGRAVGVDSPYYLTPDDVEWLGDLVHHDLAAAQAAHLKETMWNHDTLSSVLADSLGRVHSSPKRATRTAPSPI
jgi:hypothetical protein